MRTFARRREGYHAHRPRLALAGLLLMALSLTLVGCGYTTTSTGDGSTTGPSQGTSARPCVGPSAGIGVEGQPALTLNDTTPHHTGAAHIGDLIQAQLTATWHWDLTDSSANLTATQYAGSLDQARQICFWNFHAQSAGTATITFTGVMLCENARPCPMIARVETFTVQIT